MKKIVETEKKLGVEVELRDSGGDREWEQV